MFGTWIADASAEEEKLVKQCLDCHKAETESYKKTKHVEAAGCEACHFNAGVHLRGSKFDRLVSNPKDLGVKKGNGICISCHKDMDAGMKDTLRTVTSRHDDLRCSDCHRVHSTGSIEPTEKEEEEFQWDLAVNCSLCHAKEDREFQDSGHGSTQLTCLDCHEFHAAESVGEAMERSIEKCVGCHPAQDLEFRDFSAHPLQERQISCSSCHNPHSDEYPAMLAERGDRVCRECHADILVEAGSHPVSRGTRHSLGQIACMDCHRPHGSNFEHVLKYDSNSICQSCHN